MSEVAIKIENLKKQYRLGSIGGRTLNAEIQSWWARKRGLEDPNLALGKDDRNYGELFWALNGINLEVKKGEALGIIGANGAGKSTLLKILSRVTSPTEGDIWINGRVASMLEVGTGFHGELTGRENIYMNGAILGMTKKEVDSKLESIIDFSECREFIDTPVKRYSSGMYVKLAFAVASHLDAEIMIMDEVLAVGDMKFQRKCLGKMGDEAKGGRTVLYVSHNMATIRNLCTRCIVLNGGSVIFDGDVDDAISVYLENEIQNLEKYIDFTETKRNFYEFGARLFIKSLCFLNSKEAMIGTKQPTEIEVDVLAKDDIDCLCFRFTIAKVDTTIIGTAFSERSISVKKGEELKAKFRFDCSNLVPGMYYLHVVAFEKNEFGAYNNLDKPDRKVFFEVYADNNDIVWNKEWWGTVKLNTLKLVE